MHYVAAGDRLVPAAETEFAHDKAFGYRESHLCDWVEEKTGGKIQAAAVASVSIKELRVGGVEAIHKRIMDLPTGAVMVVNAASEGDLSVFAAGLLQSEAAGRRLICRTAASFVSARLGIDSSKSLPVNPAAFPSSHAAAGGLIVVGSYVPKTTAQVSVLKTRRDNMLHVVEIPVNSVLKSDGVESESSKAATQVDSFLGLGDVLVVTSRNLVSGDTPEESLKIGNQVSDCLVKMMRKLSHQPRYVLAKGGITSSDLATKGLNVQDALVAGQAAPAVPVWLLGSGSRWADTPYIVFPGNVGSESTLADIVTAWSNKPLPVSQLGWWTK